MTVYKVEDKASGQCYQCDEGVSLLVAMERRGEALIAVGCRGGGCGLCKIQIVKGDYVTKKMSRKHISEDDEKQRIVLACRTFPKTDVLFCVLKSTEENSENSNQ